MAHLERGKNQAWNRFPSRLVDKSNDDREQRRRKSRKITIMMDKCDTYLRLNWFSLPPFPPVDSFLIYVGNRERTPDINYSWIWIPSKCYRNIPQSLVWAIGPHQLSFSCSNLRRYSSIFNCQNGSSRTMLIGVDALSVTTKMSDSFHIVNSFH